MAKVTAGFSMSLDGFVADEAEGVEEVFKWYSIGDSTAEVEFGGGSFTMASEGAESIRAGGQAAGGWSRPGALSTSPMPGASGTR